MLFKLNYKNIYLINKIKFFFQVNLLKNFIIGGIETQGRYGNGTGREFAQFYILDYWRTGFLNDNDNVWIRYRNQSNHTVIFILI